MTERDPSIIKRYGLTSEEQLYRLIGAAMTSGEIAVETFFLPRDNERWISEAIEACQGAPGGATTPKQEDLFDALTEARHLGKIPFSVEGLDQDLRAPLQSARIEGAHLLPPL